MRYRDQEELPFSPVSTRERAPIPRVPIKTVPSPQSRPGNEPNRVGSLSAASFRPQPNTQPSQPSDTEEPIVIKEVWHERLIQKFFAVPPPVNPLTKNGRLYFALLFFLGAYLLVVGRLFKIQVLDHAKFSNQASDQYKMQEVIQARRGLIRDRNGVILAANAFVMKFAVDPKALQHKELVAKLFAETFHKPAQSYLAIFNDTTRQYVVIEKEVPLDVAATLDSLKVYGLMRDMESRRQYAFNERASHVVGFTSKDARGLAGIELLDNGVLAGKDGFQIMQRDGRGGRRPDVDYDKVSAVDGENLTLTIDEEIQSVTEHALKAGVETAKAEAGIAIVMNPKTGEILALANDPDFNPNDFGKATNEMLRDRAITDAYEPGSTIKVVTAACALEEGAMRPDDKIDAEGGHWNPEKGVKIADTHANGMLTFRQALEKSSNVCFAKISDKLNRRRFYKYLRDFGIGNYTGIDLPGEVKGVLHKPAQWQANSKRYMAFGYELTATPLQIATAYATVANMGVMMKPHIIAKREGVNGTEEIQPQEIRRVISEQTARTLISMLCGVVDSGTATRAKIKGVAIAGKTGTAQQLVGGHWSKEHYTSSFTGFFPAENPQYLISVILRSPHNGYYGGTVSGPIFREIAMYLLARDGKLPAEARTAEPAQQPAVDEGVVEIDGTLLSTHEAQAREIPEVRGLTLEAGRSLLASQGFVVKNATSTIGRSEADNVIDRLQKCGGDTVQLVVSKPANSEGDPRMDPAASKKEAPDFIGMPMARALKFASAKGLRVKMAGSGKIKQQFPAPGAALDRLSGQSPIVTLFGDEQ